MEVPARIREIKLKRCRKLLIQAMKLDLPSLSLSQIRVVLHYLLDGPSCSQSDSDSCVPGQRFAIVI